jgi:hypothetical protein
MEELPSCSTESFERKAIRFAADLNAVGEELRLLLREIQRVYSYHPPDPEDAPIDLEYLGCCEWLEPFDSVPMATFNHLADWTNRFQRAAKVVNLSRVDSGFSSPLDLQLVASLSHLLTRPFMPQIGNELLSAVKALTKQQETFTERVDEWYLKQLLRNADGTEPRESAATLEPKDDETWEAVKGDCYAAPAELAMVYLRNPETAAADFLRILMAFVQRYPGHVMNLMYPGLDFSETGSRLGVGRCLVVEVVLAAERFDEAMRYCRLEMPDLFGTVPSMEKLRFMAASSVSESQRCPEMIGSELEELEKSYVRFSGRFLFERLRRGSKITGINVSSGRVNEEGQLEKGTNSTSGKRTQKKGPGRERKIAPLPLRKKVREKKEAGQSVDEIKKWLEEEKGIEVSKSVIYDELKWED